MSSDNLSDLNDAELARRVSAGPDSIVFFEGIKATGELEFEFWQSATGKLIRIKIQKRENEKLGFSVDP